MLGAFIARNEFADHVSSVKGTDTISSSGSSLSVDVSGLAHVVVTLTDSCTFTLSGFPAGRFHATRFTLIQGGTGSHVPTFSGLSWADEEPVWDATIGARVDVDVYSLDGGSTMIGEHAQIVRYASWDWSGNLATGGAEKRLPFRKASRLLGTRLTANTAPTGADFVVDLTKNGTTIYAETTDRPTVEDGANDSGVNTSHSTTTLASGDWLRPEITSVGSSVTGAEGALLVWWLEA